MTSFEPDTDIANKIAFDGGYDPCNRRSSAALANRSKSNPHNKLNFYHCVEYCPEPS